jgi:hypothetical protein
MVDATSGKRATWSVVTWLARSLALVPAGGMVASSLVAACSDPGPKPAGPSFADAVTNSGPETTIDDLGTQDTEPADTSTGKQLAPCEEEGGWGCPCKKNDECISGYCIDSELGKVCTKTCSSSCPKDWNCVQAKGTSDLLYVCLPLYTNLCKPCKTHDECTAAGGGQALCVPRRKQDGSFIDGSFCGTACESDIDCRDGYACQDIEAIGGDGSKIQAKQCVPKEGGDCNCTPEWVALKVSTDCSKQNEFGVCKAIRTCVADGLTLCNVIAASAEVCDSEDNNCDGQTDEGEAIGCVVYYLDNDGDGVGSGQGQCLCKNPGVGYAKQGSDCNDLVASVKPGADEICNNFDDNCNGETDEAGAKGCKVYYLDKDGDKYGDVDDTACMCSSKKSSEWLEQGGDCDDGNPKINPAQKEKCNGKDDNCDGKTDEQGAEGCKPYYIDIDKDGYGTNESLKCLCGPTKVHTTDKGGDCDDNDKAIKPNATESCNGKDDNCNGLTDDEPASKGCPDVAGGKGTCILGKCGVGLCGKGLFDVDGKPETGCECAADNNYSVNGMTCQGPVDLGQLGDGGNTVFKSGNVMPGEAGDWYKFQATDSPDDNGGCDQFDVRVKFSDNPGGQFAFDMYRGSCAGNDQLCKEQTEGEWTTSFYGKPPSGPQAKVGENKGDKEKSPVPEKAGECKCTKAPGLPGMNICSDNSAPFWVFVYRKAGFKPTCDSYTVSFVNSPPK